MDDPYPVLGLEPGATSDEVEAAFRRQARRYPPELNPRRFARVKDAYERLTSYEKLMEDAASDPERVVESLLPPIRGRFKPLPEPLQTLSADDWQSLLTPLRHEAVRQLLASLVPEPEEDQEQRGAS